MQKKKKRAMGWLWSALLFLVMMAVLVAGTLGLSGDADEQGVAATYDAIERAAVLCYASEGYYPPGLEYIEENYGVQIDYDRYIVNYEIFASNVRPLIQVLPK